MSYVSLDRVSLVLRQAGWTAAALRRLPEAVRFQGQQLSSVRHLHPVGEPESHAPVVLVHGYGATTDCWTPLGRRLGAEAFDQVFLFGYNGLSAGLPELAEALADAVRSVLARTGSGGVHLVGHSLGGLVVRLATESAGLWPHVATLVTVATPHRGSALAWVAPGRTARSMRSGRPALPDPVLAGGADEPRYVNYYCARDAVLSRRSARFDVDGVENIEITGAGHIGAMRAGSLLAGLPAELATGERTRRPLPAVGRGSDSGRHDLDLSVPSQLSA